MYTVPSKEGVDSLYNVLSIYRPPLSISKHTMYM